MRKQVRYENNVAVTCIFIETNISGAYLVVVVFFFFYHIYSITKFHYITKLLFKNKKFMTVCTLNTNLGSPRSKYEQPLSVT